MLDTVTRDDFAACVNTIFTVFPDAPDGMDLVLAEVSEPKRGPGQETFSLLFRGPTDRFLPQGMYPMAHERLNQFDLFIVPVSRDDAGFTYEAVFNRLLQE